MELRAYLSHAAVGLWAATGPDPGTLRTDTRSPFQTGLFHSRDPGWGCSLRSNSPLLVNPGNKGADSSGESSRQERLKISLPAQLKNNSVILTASHKNILSQRYSYKKKTLILPPYFVLLAVSCLSNLIGMKREKCVIFEEFMHHFLEISLLARSPLRCV